MAKQAGFKSERYESHTGYQRKIFPKSNGWTDSKKWGMFLGSNGLKSMNSL